MIEPGESSQPLRVVADILRRLIYKTQDLPHQWRDLASAPVLATYFELVLFDLLRKGPQGGEQLLPADLVIAADRLSQQGVLPGDTPSLLRSRLLWLSSELRALGAWREDLADWWEPLPGPGPSEQAWLDLEQRLNPPKAEQLTEALTSESGLLTLIQPHFLNADSLDTIAAEIETGLQAGSLILAPEGVGGHGQVSKSRNDEVCYLTGFEIWLCQELPCLARLIQWLRRHVADLCQTALPGETIYPPARVMLTRYKPDSHGYHRHIDNPMSANNGRRVAFTLYLNPASQPCCGGELAIWAAKRTSQEPDLIVPALGGHAVFFDACKVPHQVLALRPGPARWTLVLWLNQQQTFANPPKFQMPSPLDFLLSVQKLPLPKESVAFLKLSDTRPSGELMVQKLEASAARPRIAIVSTVYRAAELLPAWCDHHLSAGVDHLILIFDHLEEPDEAALAQELADRFGSKLTLKDGAHIVASQQALLAEDPRHAELLALLERGGNASAAVCARQTLGASWALKQAALGRLPQPIDWLVHLDADEWLWPEGAGRGGRTLPESFAAAEAAGLKLLRFANHELLREDSGKAPRFKVNPRLAIMHLGQQGWMEVQKLLHLGQSEARPWFTGYHNGKSAVRVPYGRSAAGVHGWYLKEPSRADEAVFLAGPHVLHLHLSNAARFAQKFLAIAETDPSTTAEPSLFQPSPVEDRALALIQSARVVGSSRAEIQAQLHELYQRLTTFTALELALLEEAGLLLKPVGLVLPVMTSQGPRLSPLPH